MIASVDATTVAGKHIALYPCRPGFTPGACDAPRPAPSTVATITHVPLVCGDDAIASVRVNLASAQVAGWNELDAIGGVARAPAAAALAAY